MHNNSTPRIALVTGGTSGIGLSIARALAAQGVFVHLIGRDPEKGARAVAELAARGGRGRFVSLDLADLRAVRAFARQFRDEAGHLDTLVLAAGVVLPRRLETADGIEKTLAVDHLSAVLLARELRPLLALAARGRIVSVSGPRGQVLRQRIAFDDLQLEQGYSLNRAVLQGLHAKTVMTEVLGERFAEDGIDVIAFDPGGVRSDLGRDLTFPFSAVIWLMQRFQSTESAAGIFASTSEALDGITGAFVVKEAHEPLRFDPAYKDRVVEVTDALLHRVLAA